VGERASNAGRAADYDCDFAGEIEWSECHDGLMAAITSST
jgi:hypothetical protein